MVGLVAPDAPTFALKWRLARSGEIWRITRLQGEVGRSDIAGTIGIDAAGEKPMITGDLVSRKLDLYDLGPVVGLPARGARTDAPLGLGGKAERGPARPTQKDQPEQERAHREPSPGAFDGSDRAQDSAN